VLLVAGAVVVATGITVLGASAHPTEPAAPSAVTVPVAASVRVCPSTPAPPAPSDTRTTTANVVVSAATLPQPALPAPASDGQVTLTPLSGRNQPSVSLTAAGTQGSSLARSSTVGTSPVALRGIGSLAPGATATQVRYVPSGAGRSLVGQACPEPTGSAWFLGGSGASGHDTTIELDNPDATQAVADIVIYGPHGVLVSPAARGIAIPGHGHVALRLNELAPQVARPGLHVILRAGRASITVTDLQTAGLLARGSDVVPQTSAPAHRLVIPGVPGGQKGSRTLQVLAPGDQNALVQVQVIGRNGRFTPDELSGLNVPAGRVTQAQLLSQVGDGSVGLVLSSDVPIVAAVRNFLPSRTGTPDLTFSAATRSLAGPVLAAGLRTSPKRGTGSTSRLFLSAPAGDARAELTLLSADGTSSSQSVAVTGGTSAEYTFPKGPKSFTLLVSPAPEAGPLYGAIELDYVDHFGALATSWPLVAAPLTDTLPPVRQDPALGVPGS
jgi:hypothetical protein